MPWGNQELFESSRQVSRNVTVTGRRTSMRMESSLWEALEEIARRERCSVNELCNRIDARRRELSLTGAVRVALVGYYRDQGARGADRDRLQMVEAIGRQNGGAGPR